ncbi:hypothetical protein GE061_011366 [Apolygus lucorum]|uniref:Uncharacterized protein n=1 Tax=Apolygus lucorum TaxID=248454 RepID=A0A6A4JIC1_APOLU|nr:hypothetical protein GE061_011366 [Apolygus lucorum]
MASTSKEIPSEANAVMDDRRELNLRSRVVNIVTSTTPERVLENRGADRKSDRSSRRTGRSSSSTSTIRRRDVEQLRLELQQEEEKEAKERQVRQADRERRLRALELAISNGSESSRTRASVGQNSDTNSVESNGRVVSWVDESRRNLNLGLCSGLDVSHTQFQHQSRPPLGNEVSVDELKGWIARKNTTFELPNFDGDPAQWPLFISMYRRSTESGRYTEDENLVRLQKALKGAAREHIEPLLFLPGGLGRVIDRLQRRYGRPDAIAREVMTKLEKVKNMGEDGLTGLDEMAAVVDNAVTTVALVGRSEYLYNPVILNILVSKLNVFLKLQWGEHVTRLGDGPVSLERFNDWLQDKVEAIGNAGAWDIAIQSAGETCKQGERSKSETKEDAKSKPNHTVLKCLQCNVSSHTLKDCRKFARMSDDDRFQWARENEICFGCLQKGHRGFSCKANVSCKVCKKHHNTLLHPRSAKTVATLQETEREQSEDEDGDAGEEATSQDNVVTAVNIEKERRLLLRIVPVKLHGPLKTVETYAFLDSGSTVTMIREDMAAELGLQGEKQPLKVRWTDNSIREENESQVVSFSISGVKENAKTFSVYRARTVRQLNLPQQTVNPALLGQSFEHLKDLEISAYKDAKPTILLGEDNWALAIPLKVVHRSWNGPVATKTRLGWVLHGKIPLRLKGRVNDEEDHQLSQWSEEDDGTSLHDLVKEFVLGEKATDVNKDKELSTDDERAVATFESTTRRVEGRWETGLLWKSDHPLPQSRGMALKRFYNLEKRMDKDPAFAKQYISKMEESIAKGYVSKLEPHELNMKPRREWYLPHLGVVNPNKPGKLRICFDASAKVDGVSLNDSLLTGPDLLVSLPGLLCRFREHPIAIGGDIKEMYPQIKIRHEDQMAQKFFWRGRDRSKPPEEFAVRVMTFGARCSPFSAQEVKNRNALEQKLETKETISAIVSNHYMDDYLDSCQDEQEAITRVHDVCRVHKLGGFIMCNWISNSLKVLESLPVDLRSAKGASLDLGENQSEKLLGLWWRPSNDEFHFQVKVERLDKDLVEGKRNPTKREVLRWVMTLFDPLGLIMFVVNEGKMLLQEVWREGIKWDQDIGDKLSKDWAKWMQRVLALTNISIPRCYNLAMARDIQLHVMCDASERAYAAVSYIRTVTTQGRHVKLCVSKARVAPVKQMSIPRLELQAALTAVHLARFVIKEHRIEFSRVIFWSDSQIVLSWIRATDKRLQAYVKRRIDQILEGSSRDAWKWVPTKDNCADDATRVSKTVTLNESERWFTGPTLLWKDEDEWPKEPSTQEIMDDNTEYVAMNREAETELLPDITRFSQWLRLIRTTAWVPRIAKFLLYRDDSMKRELETEELQVAELQWLRKTQGDAFDEELSLLQQRKPLPTDCRLARLDPFLDEKGLIRVGSRIGEAENVAYDTKYPIVLPYEHPYTKLLLGKYHRWAQHQGKETILNALRQKYWVLRARLAVKSSFNRCGLCQLKRATPQPPKMAPLPPARMAHNCRPFTSVGLDYFGPLQVTIGRRQEKRYVALFTCLTVRAVHLEVATDLSSGSAIMAIRRFIARRGTPREIFSDNGTNFKKADRELKDAFRDLQADEVQRQLAPHGIKWIFNCPAAPHMGGAWERLVQTVKKALNATLNEQAPREDVLTTALAEVEFIVNSRPLTQVSVDPADMECLTPNHFLLGDALGSPVGPPISENVCLRMTWRKSQQIADSFWKRWVNDYLPELVKRNKWTKSVEPLKIGDLVVLGEDTYPRGRWPRGIVVATFPGKDGQVRSANIKTSHGIFRRPATKIAKLHLQQ